jgi:autotransporter-associated beta strand protein
MIPIYKFGIISTAFGLLSAPHAMAAVDYLDASPTNTTLADGTALNLVASSPADPQDYTTSGSSATANNHWHLRTGFANGSDVWASASGASPYTNDSSTLRTTLTGLTPGQLYNVYVYYWVAGNGAAVGNQQWDVRTGFDTGAMTNVPWNSGTNLGDTSGHFNTAVLVIEADRRLFEYKVGARLADGSGNIQVYVDDLPGNSSRTWFDGVGSEISSDRIWDGGGDAFWTTATNWVGDVAPSAGDPLTFAGDAGLSNENDFAADTEFGGINFDSASDSFTLSGNRITLSGDIANQSSNAQTIELPILLDTDCAVTGPIYLDGAISGPFGLAKSGAALLELTGANDYTGVLTVTGGLVNLINDQSGANGGMLIGPLSASPTVVTIDVGASASVAAGKEITIGNAAASGFAAQTLSVSGTMTNDGTLNLGRIAQMIIEDGGAWTQTGNATLSGVGGYTCNLDVKDGGVFNFTDNLTFLLNGTNGNSGQARLNVLGSGVFSTGVGFEQLTTPTTGYGRVTLSNGGTLQLTANIPNLTTEVQFVLDTGGGVIDTNGFDSTLSGVVTVGGTQTGIAGVGSLTKKGAGTLTTSGVNAYTGSTIIQGGTLQLTNASLSDFSTVELTTGAIINLSHAETDTIDKLFIDGEQMSSGTWGALDSAAENKSALITGTGLLSVATGPGFAGWATALGLSGDPDDDFDLDGLSDAIEYLIGSDPIAPNSLNLEPDATGSNLVFTFPRDDNSETSDVSLVVEIGTTLDAWPTVLTVGVDTASSDSGIEVTENGAAPDTITVTIPKADNPATFARLKVTITP